MSDSPIFFLVAYFFMAVAYGIVVLKFWRQYRQFPDGLFLGFAGCLSLGGLTGLITTFWIPALSPILILFQLFTMTFLFLAMLKQTKQWRLWPIPVALTAVVTLLNLAIFDLEDSVTVMSVFLALMLLTLPAIGMALYLAKRNGSKYLLSIELGMLLLILGGIFEQSIADPVLCLSALRQSHDTRGRVGGRPRKLDAKKTELAFRLYEEKKHTVSEICQMLAISKPTLYAYLGRRHKNQKLRLNPKSQLNNRLFTSIIRLYVCS